MTAGEPLRTVVVEDEILLREGLQSLMRGAGFDVVAVAADADGATAAVLDHRPDLLITDIRIPPGYGTDGLDAALRLRHELPGLAVMVLSQYVSRHLADRLLGGGAQGVGYQLKQRVSDLGTFLADVRRVADGGTALDPDVVEALFGHARPATAPQLDRLTGRQREVLALIAQGRSNSAIAAQLHIAEKTVVAHTSRIYAELGIPEHDDDHRRVLAVLRYLGAG